MAQRRSVGRYSRARIDQLVRAGAVDAALPDPEGSDTEIQYNNDGVFGGASGLVYIDSGSNTGYSGFGVGGASVTHRITLPDTSGPSGRVLANSYNTYSTRRLKKNIKNIEDPISMVMKMRGVSFDWKKSGLQDVGFIAEEVGDILPEIVDYENNGIDARSMDYSRITPLLLECIKKQQFKIEKLEKKLIALEELYSNKQ